MKQPLISSSPKAQANGRAGSLKDDLSVPNAAAGGQFKNRRNRLLLVDDDDAVREALANALGTEGLEVVTATNGREALGIVAENRPDLVLLDVNMPGMNGWEAFSELEQKCALVPVIVITAYPGQYGRANRLGVDALMEKPIDLPLLVRTIRELLAEEPEHRAQRLAGRGFATRDLTGHPAAGSKWRRGWPIA